MDHDESFARWVMESYPGLLRRAVLLVGDRGHAEDLVQSSLASVYSRWRTVEVPDAYVRTVMARRASHWRARRWHREHPTEVLPDATGVDPLAGVDAADAVRIALMALPVDQRAVIVLRYFDDCSEAAIAEILGCSPGTVKSRAARAIASLRANGLLAAEGLQQ